jgi:hypothetical protein
MAIATSRGLRGARSSRTGVPVLMIDVKGDLPDLLLAFPSFDPGSFFPWVEGGMDPTEEQSPQQIAETLARERQSNVGAWGISEPDLRAFRDTTAIRVITPGSTAGEPLHASVSVERIDGPVRQAKPG